MNNKRKIAWHEAGHAVIARHFGVAASAHMWIDKRDDGSKTLWRGQTWFPPVTISAEVDRMISVAGATAVYCLDYPDDDPDVLDYDLISYGMSPADLTIDGVLRNYDDEEELWRAAVDRVYPLLQKDGPLWRNLQREAKVIIRKAHDIIKRAA